MAFPTSTMIGVSFASHDDTAKFKVGTVAKGTDGSEWVYVEASNAIGQYKWAAIDENFLAVAGTSALADAFHGIGIAPVAFLSSDYGWIQVEGTAIATFSGTATADISLYTSATAGEFDDVTSGAEIEGITLVTAVSTQSQTATVIMRNVHRNHAGSGGASN